MPSASIYNPENRDLHEIARKERDDRAKLHATNLKYYKGEHQKHLKMEGVWDDNVVLNIARQTVDRLIAFLFPELPKFHYPNLETNGAGNDDLERQLEAKWKANGGIVTLQNLATVGCLDGQVYARIQQPKFEGDKAKIIIHDSSKVITFWSEDDKHEVLWYEVQWKLGKREYKQDIVRGIAIDKIDGIVPYDDGWYIFEYERVAGSGTWELKDTFEWALPHPYAPIASCQHYPSIFDHYGQTEFQHVRTNDLINYVATNINRILRFHAHPRTVGTGFERSDLQETGVSDFWTIPDKDAKVYTVEMQTDLSSSMAYLDMLIRQYLAESRVVSLDNVSLDSLKNTTNLGIRTLFKDQLSKNEVLRRTYGGLIVQISHTLMMLDDPAYIPDTLDLVWGDALPENDMENTQIVAMQMNLGLLSPQTASANLGYDWKQEQKNMGQAQFEDMAVRQGLPSGVVDGQTS